MAQLPLELVQRSEDLQVVHYTAQQSFGMHHDSSAFQPRLLTAFYYLNRYVSQVSKVSKVSQ